MSMPSNGITGQVNTAYRKTSNRKRPISELEYAYFDAAGHYPYEFVITAPGVYECGPFGPDGAEIQFASADQNSPFVGDFAATVSRSLMPGAKVIGQEGHLEMRPASHLFDFDVPTVGGLTEASLGQIIAVAGRANRLRIHVTSFDPGPGGGLLIWVM